jgi:hypothetical protein
MVHLGGQGEQRLAASGWRLGHHTGGRGWGLGRVASMRIAALAILSITLPGIAAAQPAIGFQGGVAVDPEQVFGGVFWQSDDLFGGFRIRPGVDGATGDGYRIGGINFDFIYGFPLGASGWTLIQGGGPSIVITRIPELDLRDTGVGAAYIFGFGHDSGFFTEFRLGSGNAQRLKIGVGWAIALD